MTSGRTPTPMRNHHILTTAPISIRRLAPRVARHARRRLHDVLRSTTPQNQRRRAVMNHVVDLGLRTREGKASCGPARVFNRRCTQMHADKVRINRLSGQPRDPSASPTVFDATQYICVHLRSSVVEIAYLFSWFAAARSAVAPFVARLGSVGLQQNARRQHLPGAGCWPVWLLGHYEGIDPAVRRRVDDVEH
jgi:hypothetical protein